MARGRGSGKKSGSKPTGKKRSATQSLKDRYAHAREDAQLAGLIPTTPEEALKAEAVSPADQTDAPHPELVVEAIRRGWAVPEEKKPKIVDELLAIISSSAEMSKTKVAAFNALRMADQQQYERDNPIVKPGQGGQLPGSTTNNTTIYGDVVNNKLVTAQTIREMIERGELGILTDDSSQDRPDQPTKSTQAPDITSPPSSSGQ